VSVDWSEVYRATYGELVRFLYRKVWDAERARDLAQEVFVRALRHQPENPRAWLFHVAGNLARDEARRAQARRHHLQLLRSDPATAPSVAPEITDEMDRNERIQAVRDALEQLGERDRDALLLREAGLSYSEIAMELGLALGAVGTTLARARQRLVRAYQALEEKHAARG
jgi:RNA polymerase sigma factor (sigma-70 family)